MVSVRKQDELDRQVHIKKALRSFQSLLNRLKPVASQVLKEQNPSDDKELKRTGRLFVTEIKDDRSVLNYLDKWIGKSTDDSRAYSWRSSVIYQIRDVLIFNKPINEALEKVTKEAFKGFQAITMTRLQTPYREAIPPEIRTFLPKNIVVEVDRSGLIQRITDRFENEELTLEVKINKMKDLVKRYNSIARSVKKDLRSDDERVKLSALITAIIMETGIRPGKIGRRAFVVKDGEKIEVETFGAVTLGPAHVNFVKSNFAKLEFIGKMGSLNLSSISNRNLIKILKEYVDRALTKGSKYIFVDSKGERFTYDTLQKYFKSKFKVAPTDFRKLKATETILNALKEEQEDLYSRIRSFEKEKKEDLKQRIVEEVALSFDRAIKRSQQALSHDSSTTTVEDYINPQVILRFLSTGRMDATLKEVVLSGEDYLKFDPLVFLERAKGSKKASFGFYLRRFGSWVRL